VPIEGDNGRIRKLRRLRHQVGHRALAIGGEGVLDGRGAAEGVQHLLRAIDDPLLLGGDEAHEAQCLVLHKLLA
jgi:hypothetical protein